MHVRVDVTGQDEFVGATDLFAELRGILFPHRDAFDLIAVDHNRRIWQHFAISRVDHRPADERNFFSARTQGNQTNGNTK